MGDFELLKFNSDHDLARAAAEEFLAALPGTGSFSVALSGGRIARNFFSAVAGSAQASSRLKSVHFFWGDERCVPPNDPESNFAIAHELLLRPLGISADRVHRIKGEIDPETAARQAEAELRQHACVDTENKPVIDLLFLGMGEDGHVASLFPGEREELRNDPAIYRAVTAVKPPPHRITLGYRTIFAASEVWLLASGAGKESALKESFSPNGRTPLAHVIHSRQFTRILTDVHV